MSTVASKTLLFAALVGLCAVGAFPGDAAAQSSPVAPTLIPVSGRLLTPDGQPRTGPVSLVISLYDTQNDNAPRWIEQQDNVTLDATGAYSVQFGVNLPDGLPGDLFTTGGGTRWLGVKAVGDASDQPRVMLVSVPYAAKAASAEMLGGKSASDFVLTSTFRDDLRTVLEEEGVTGGAGEVGTEAVTLNYLQKGTGSGTTTTDSAVIETGGRVGLGVASPSAVLHTKAPNANVTSLSSLLGNSVFFEGSSASGASIGSAVSYDSYFGAALIQAVDAAGAFGRSFALNPYGGSVGVGTFPLAAFHLKARNANVSSLGTLFPNAAFFEGSSATGASIGTAFAFDSYLGSAIMQAVDAAATAGRSLTINPYGGNVGIGIVPAAKFHVAGNAVVTGDLVVNGNIAAKYQDVAEWVDAAKPLEAGTLVVIDSSAKNRVTAAAQAYDSRVAGAVSPQPGLILGEPGDGKVLVAQSGRVRVKADAKNGAIRPGDLLVSSPVEGHVMRSRAVKVGDYYVHRPGTVVGKALEGLPSGRGEILVLLTLQ